MVGVLGAGPPLEEVRTLDRLAEVLPQRLLGGHEEDVAPVGCLVDLIADAVDHARGARLAALVVVGLVPGDLGLGALVGPPCLRAVPVHGCGGVRLGDLEARALAGGLGPQHGGHDAERPEEGTGVDAHGGVLGKVGEAGVVDGRRDDAGPGVEGHAVGGQVLVGTGHAVAGDGAEDQVGLEGPQVVPAHAPLGQHTGPAGLDDHVAGDGQLLEDLDVLGVAEVHDDRALAPVEVEVHQRHALDDGPGHLPDVVAGRRLHLDDLGAQVDEGHGDGGRAERGDLEDADAVERGVGGHGASCGVAGVPSGTGLSGHRGVRRGCGPVRDRPEASVEEVVPGRPGRRGGVGAGSGRVCNRPRAAAAQTRSRRGGEAPCARSSTD